MPWQTIKSKNNFYFNPAGPPIPKTIIPHLFGFIHNTPVEGNEVLNSYKSILCEYHNKKLLKNFIFPKFLSIIDIKSYKMMQTASSLIDFCLRCSQMTHCL